MTAANHAPIPVFARERDCPDVVRTRPRMTELGLPVSERDVEADDTAAADLRRLCARVGVFAALIAYRGLVELSNRELDAALVASGHLTSVPGRPS